MQARIPYQSAASLFTGFTKQDRSYTEIVDMIRSVGYQPLIPQTIMATIGL